MALPRRTTGSLCPTLTSLFDWLILQSSKHIPLRSKHSLEFAFEHLRYFLGGDRPSQTTSYRLSLIKNLVKLYNEGGISRPPFEGLPPILHTQYNHTI
jgi:hypothetical protein